MKIATFQQFSRLLVFQIIFCLMLTATISAAPSLAAFPAPSEWRSAPNAPNPPGDVFALPQTSSAPVINGAPVISEWTKTVLPNESFALTGVRFTRRTGAQSGSDTSVWLWADTPTGGVLRQCDVWSITGDLLTATVPSDVPRGMYLVWVENETGISAPVPLNRAAAQWLSPFGNKVAPGGTKRIFGKNLARNHDLSSSYVYLQPAAGGAFAPLAVTNVEPYAVEFQIPATTAPGAYKVFLHNGNGGIYGWSAPLDLIVAASWQRGTGEIVVEPSGGDDTPIIQTAIDTLTNQANGGTVRLVAGIYQLGGQLWMKSNVRLLGAGMNNTKVELRLQTIFDSNIVIFGDHITLENFHLYLVGNVPQPVYGPIKTTFPGPYDDMRLLGLRINGDFVATIYSSIDMRATNGEIAGCDFSRRIDTAGSDIWIHNNTLRGGPFDGTEAAVYTDGDNIIVERNNIATDWPTGPNGNRNYHEFMPIDQVARTIWAKRFFLASPIYRSVERSYLAWNTGNNVAVDDNRGEIFLFHGSQSKWYAQVASNNKRTLTIRTDGLIDGQQRNVDGVPAARSVPDNVIYGVTDRDSYVVIVSGTGRGQSRRVASHTATTITVQEPWRVAPASNSKIILTFLHRDPIIYKNDINAFPEGYRLTYSASTGISMDGNMWGAVAESNTMRRTYGARIIGATNTGVSYWNEMRGENTYDAYHMGNSLIAWRFESPETLGPSILGSHFRGGNVTVQPSQNTDGAGPISLLNAQISPYEGGTEIPSSPLTIAGSSFENVTASGSEVGSRSAQWTQVLLRNNNLSVRDNPDVDSGPLPFFWEKRTDAILSGNQYAGAENSPTYITNDVLKARLAMPQRTLNVEARSVPVMTNVPLLNTGSAATTWTATPLDPWITVGSTAGSLNPESTINLTITVDPTSKPAGIYRGLIKLQTGTGQQSYLGVKLVVNQSPVGGGEQTVFTTQTPVLPDATDNRSYELGMKFQASTSGAITAIRYYKSPSETGSHTGTIWSSTGSKLAEIGFANETAAGWQQVSLPAPLAIAANTTYVVTVNTNARYAFTNAGLANAITNGNLTTVVGNNAVYGDVGAFPTNSYQNSNYFRDVIFRPAP